MFLHSRSFCNSKSFLRNRNITSLISNKTLLRSTGFINGVFQDSNSESQTFNVFNPADGKILATLPRMNAKHVEIACTAANDAFSTWKLTTAVERSKILRKMADLMGENANDLALLISLESGKPLAEAKGEVGYAQSFYELYSEEAKRFSGEVLQPPMKGRRMLSLKQPVGPAGLITPWNFPSAMITRKVGPALAAGCTVVIKPSEETPLSALALCAIAQQAGVPAGVINCLTVGREEVTEVGLAMCHNLDLRKVCC
jgi:acyl-CoA reductase-like NAD-dependent aldehyde dehydrogenase